MTLVASYYLSGPTSISYIHSQDIAMLPSPPKLSGDILYLLRSQKDNRLSYITERAAVTQNNPPPNCLLDILGLQLFLVVEVEVDLV